MGCASSIVPQQQQSQQQPGRSGRPKHKLNALVPEPPARPAAPVSSGPRVGLVSIPGLGTSGPERTAVPSTSGSPAAIVNDPQNYEELCVAFLKAVKRGDVPTMEVVAQLGMKLTPTPQSLVNIRGMWESTPLVYATQYAHVAAAHWLLARGADVLAQNEKGVTALLLASLEGMTDVCEKILSVAALMGPTGSTDKDKREERGLTAPRAVDQQVGVVYNSAADMNVRLSPLLAASMNGHAGVAALLLAHGANPNRPVGSMVTGGVAVDAKQFALLLAAKYGHAAVLELLLTHGVDCSVRDTSSSHAVLLACENRREDCALLLLRHAAYDQVDSNGDLVARRNVWLQPNRRGLTALHLAATHGLVAAAAALVSLARQQNTADCGSGAATEDLREFLDAVSVTRGETALLMACRRRQFEVARVLLEAGADSARADRGGTTPAQVLERSEQSELLAMSRAAAMSSAPTVKAPVAAGEEKSELPTIPVAPTTGSTSDGNGCANDRQVQDGRPDLACERGDDGNKQAGCQPSGVCAEEGCNGATPSSNKVVHFSKAETTRSPLCELPRLRDTPDKGGVGDDGYGIVKSLDESARGGDGDGDSATSNVLPAVVEDHVRKRSSKLSAGPTSTIATASTTATPSASLLNVLDKLDEPDSGDSFARNEIDRTGNGTAAASAAVVTNAPTAGDIDRLAPLDAAMEQLVGGPAVLANDAHEPTVLLPLIAIERDGGAIAAEHGSPRCTEVEGDDDERASSTASMSPKERTKKSSKRKKKRDNSDQGRSSPSSSTHHYRRHRHKVTKKSMSAAAAVDGDANVAVVECGAAQTAEVERVTRRSKERSGGGDASAQVTR